MYSESRRLAIFSLNSLKMFFKFRLPPAFEMVSSSSPSRGGLNHSLLLGGGSRLEVAEKGCLADAHRSPPNSGVAEPWLYCWMWLVCQGPSDLGVQRALGRLQLPRCRAGGWYGPAKSRAPGSVPGLLELRSAGEFGASGPDLLPPGRSWGRQTSCGVGSEVALAAVVGDADPQRQPP